MVKGTNKSHSHSIFTWLWGCSVCDGNKSQHKTTSWKKQAKASRKQKWIDPREQ